MLPEPVNPVRNGVATVFRKAQLLVSRRRAKHFVDDFLGERHVSQLALAGRSPSSARSLAHVLLAACVATLVESPRHIPLRNSRALSGHANEIVKVCFVSAG